MLGIALTIIVGKIVVIGVLILLLLCLISFPAFSIMAVIGMNIWIDHGIVAGLLAAAATYTVFHVLSMYKKTHLAVSIFTSTLMCGVTVMLALSLLEVDLVLKGWLTIPVMVLALFSTYTAVSSKEGNYKADKNGIILNIVAAVLHGLTISLIVTIFAGGLGGVTVSDALVWITFGVGSVVAFILELCGIGNWFETLLAAD